MLICISSDIELDPGFAHFYDWTLQNHVPVIVLSSGMEPLIRALLAKLLGSNASNIPILSNQVEIRSDGSCSVRFRDESGTHTPPSPLCVSDEDRFWT